MGPSDSEQRVEKLKKFLKTKWLLVSASIISLMLLPVMTWLVCVYYNVYGTSSPPIFASIGLIVALIIEICLLIVFLVVLSTILGIMGLGWDTSNKDV